MTDSPASIDPRRSALLVMDYQPGILGNLDDPDGMLEKTGEAIAAMREVGGTVGYVRVAMDPSEVEEMPPTNKMSERVKSAGDAFHHESPLTAVHDSIAPEEGDIVVRKIRIGAFSTTDLDQQLRDRGIDTLILAGISTSGVVLSTVRDGADKDYRLVVLSDACADAVPGAHEFLTGTVFPRQADVITVADFTGLLENS